MARPVLLVLLSILFAGCASGPLPTNATSQTNATGAAGSTEPTLGLVVETPPGVSGPEEPVAAEDCARHVFVRPWPPTIAGAFDALANGTTIEPARGMPAPEAFRLPHGTTIIGAGGFSESYRVAVEGSGDAWNVTVTATALDWTDATSNEDLAPFLTGFFENLTGDAANASAYADAVLAQRHGDPEQTTVPLQAPLLSPTRLADLAGLWGKHESVTRQEGHVFVGWPGAIQLDVLLPTRSMEWSLPEGNVTIEADALGYLNATVREASPELFGTTGDAILGHVSPMLTTTFPLLGKRHIEKERMTMACTAGDAPRGVRLG